MGSGPSSKGSRGSAGRAGTRSLGVPRLPQPRTWCAEVAGRGGGLGDTDPTDPTENLRHQTRASICPRPIGCPLLPGAAPLAPPRPRPCCGRRCRLGRGGGCTRAVSGSGSQLTEQDGSLLLPRLWPRPAERVPILCPSQAAREERFLFQASARRTRRNSPPSALPPPHCLRQLKGQFLDAA